MTILYSTMSDNVHIRVSLVSDIYVLGENMNVKQFLSQVSFMCLQVDFYVTLNVTAI